LRDSSTSQENKPLLGNERKRLEQTSSNKFLYFVLCLLFITIILITVTLNKNSHNGKSKHLVIVDEWSVLESVETSHVSKRWTLDSLCDDDEVIELTFAIKQQNTDSIHDKLYEVSDPSSSKYGQHWSMEEIHDFLKPSDTSIAAVLNWIEQYGINSNDIQYLTVNKDFMRIKTTVKVANEMLNTKYGYWVNKEGEKHMRVQDVYYVPAAIVEYLDFISPTLRFPPKRHTNKVTAISSKAISTEVSITYNTPIRLRSLYHMQDYVNSASYPGHFQSIASFLGEWYTSQDIEMFWDYFGIENVDLVRVPSTQPDGDGDEAELDIEYITSTGSGIDTYVWDVEDDLYFITLIQQIMDSEHPPSVVSMSYGGDEQSSGYSYCNRANIEFAKVGLYGVTSIASSGDNGASGDSDDCTSEYYPSFPASSPYVVAVGGTTGGNIQSDLDKSTGETAWVDSGGGFSWFFSRQSWQNDAVNEYFNTVSKLPTETRYNSLGRGYPDISAQSVSFIICSSSQFLTVSGTSCSCPSVAGMIALINDARLQKGKSTLGWMLPAFYKIMANSNYYVNDVTIGYNIGCSTDDYIGFLATELWDPVTGFGTPKFPRLYEALVNL